MDRFVNRNVDGGGGDPINQGQPDHDGHYVPGSETETERGSSGLVDLIHIVINVTSQPNHWQRTGSDFKTKNDSSEPIDAIHTNTNATTPAMQDSHDDKHRFGVSGSAVVEKQGSSELVARLPLVHGFMKVTIQTSQGGQATDSHSEPFNVDEEIEAE
ncbi:hypothetical protein BP00DRAFT_425389 [Aspergillus indologenus CBS 114.80]|uniref:Uncharacterized protein n=1 Tax=Aspergillus indologenus CBS 114.80 TaxID=1450541 RepID=A0A2V5J3B3_9EURO|nr:hypothetical protein BP00DRAFT_425389 [Aspergillus indologenus CBS 114.80]